MALALLVALVAALLVPQRAYCASFDSDAAKSLNEYLGDGKGIGEAGSYKLTIDLELPEDTLIIGNGQEMTVSLDLNGHKLSGGDGASVIVVTKNVTLNLFDTSVGKTGVITGGRGTSNSDSQTDISSYGGGIVVYGTLNMYGGTISGNSADVGGGVYVVKEGTFNLYGGTITANTADERGGGVAIGRYADDAAIADPAYIDAEITGWNEVDGGDVSVTLSLPAGMEALGDEDTTVSDGKFGIGKNGDDGNQTPVVVTANKLESGSANNVYVPKDVTLSLLGTPFEGSRIGITMEAAVGLFASCTDASVSSASVGYFVSDAGGYYVSAGSAGLSLYAPAPPPTYTPEIVAPEEGGTVTVRPTNPQEGDEVVISVDPEPGLEVDEVVVTDEDGNLIEVTYNEDGTWSFIQPEGEVTIVVTFRCDGGELCPSHEFPDVDQSQWYHGAIDFAVTSGLMIGYADSGLFGPVDLLGREQAAQVLYRAFGDGAVAPACPLSDVDQSAWYAPAVNWAYASGLLTGYDDGSGLFGVGDALTRDQFAAIVARVAKADLSQADPSALDAFSDGGEVAEWAVPAVSWAAQAGVLEGSPDGEGGMELRSSAEINRAEMAAMVMRVARAGLFPTPA